MSAQSAGANPHNPSGSSKLIRAQSSVTSAHSLSAACTRGSLSLPLCMCLSSGAPSACVCRLRPSDLTAGPPCAPVAASTAGHHIGVRCDRPEVRLRIPFGYTRSLHIAYFMWINVHDDSSSLLLRIYSLTLVIVSAFVRLLALDWSRCWSRARRPVHYAQYISVLVLVYGFMRLVARSRCL